ncbi:hypothetical protein GCM10023340_24710 [Nocardioides marinquilinus]|uniref:Aminoglycoside phosphotransferase domain-containing protein n=1 Tax=Nocardioides marinquilinus TaxID=1210400 RepID=A0ABP9PTA9_9ACTN
MWEPEPGWHPLPGGLGASTVGVWRTARGDDPLVVKRVAAPVAGDPPELSDPTHHAYWRREADVLATGVVAGTRGLRGVVAATVEEDADGITITRPWVEDAALSGLFVAVSLGRFARAGVPRPAFCARQQLRTRLERTERRGGWPTLGRTTAADVADHLWSRRETFLDILDSLPQVSQHGDPSHANIPGRDGDDAVAIDWSTFGVGPVGADLGYFSLMAREELDPLLDAYRLGLDDPRGSGEPVDVDDVVLGARITAVYTGFGRAEWALARVAGGEGALAGKFRHPSVAPYLRALQRQSASVEALLGW